MMKGLAIGVCVYVLIFLLYLTFGPMIGQYVAHVNGRLYSGPPVARNVAVHWILITAIVVLGCVLVRDAYLFLRVKLRGPEKDE